MNKSSKACNLFVSDAEKLIDFRGGENRFQKAEALKNCIKCDVKGRVSLKINPNTT